MTFGETLRDYMTRRGMSLRTLARTLPADKGYLSKLCRDLRRPSAEMARRLDDALRAGGALVAAAGAVPSPNGLSPDDAERVAMAVQRPARVDLTVVESLATILAAQRRTEDIIGSGPLVEPVRVQLDAIQTLADEARGDIRTKVLDVGAQWVQFYAWLNANLGQLDHADRLQDRAIVWATEAGNADMTATAFNMKGYAAWLRGNVGAILGLSQASHRMGRSPGVRALAAQQEARGHAIARDGEMVDRRLDEARALAAAAAECPQEQPPWIYFFSPRYFDMQQARAYLYLPDRQAAAVELLTASLAALPADVLRSEWGASYLADLGRAYLLLHEDDEARRIAEDLADLARQIGSTRLARQAAALRS